MIQMGSVVKIADNSGAKSVKCYHVMGSTGKKIGHVGDIVCASVFEAIPNGKIKKGDKVKVVIVATKSKNKRQDGSCVSFDENLAVIDGQCTRILYPISREIRDVNPKLLSIAVEVL